MANPWLTVIGVVGDVKQAGLDVATQPHTYEPYTQADDDRVSFAVGLNIVVRTDGDPLAMSSAVRAQVQELDKQLAVSNIQTMTEVVRKSIAQRRFDTFLMGVFASRPAPTGDRFTRSTTLKRCLRGLQVPVADPGGDRKKDGNAAQ